MLRVRDIMSADVLTVSPELRLRETVELLAAKHVSGAPVLAGSKVVGVISATDLLEFEAATPGVPTDRPDQMEVGEWGAPEVHRLLVIDAGKLVGIVTTTDVMRAVAEGRLKAR